MHAEQGEARGCRLAVQHRMTRRCTSWDYRARAIYQITLVQADRRRPALGRLVVENSSAAPEAVAARVEPSELGAGRAERIGRGDSCALEAAGRFHA